MRSQRVPGPVGQRVERVVIRALDAHVEPELAPGHQLIQDRLGVFAGAPPATSLPRGLGPKSVDIPILTRHELGEDLMAGDVTEMKVG